MTRDLTMFRPRAAVAVAVGAFVLASLLTMNLDGSIGVAGRAHAQITVTKARIGCLDIQTGGNLTTVVGRVCNDHMSCSYPAPTEEEYRKAGVAAATRFACTQAMEIVYRCAGGGTHTVFVPGNAWDRPPAHLVCTAAVTPPPTTPTTKTDVIHVTRARIGCLDIQTAGNLTGLVGQSCNGREMCAYKAPTEEQYRKAGVTAATRTFCTQAMEITYDCGRNDPRTAFVPGDAWDHPAAQLACQGPPPGPAHTFGPGEGPITVTSARIGCLDVQKSSNLTQLVAPACNGREVCEYKAPTPDAYKHAGVVAATRDLCTQGMEINYRCGKNDEQTVTVPGDAWTHPPARLVCNGRTVATNYQDVTPPPPGTGGEAVCKPPKFGAPEYVTPPKDMLDWTPVAASEIEAAMKHYMAHGDLPQLMSGFIPAPQPGPALYDPAPTKLAGSPGSTFGANEGRVRNELRAVAKKKDPLGALCQAAQRFTANRPATPFMPADKDLGNAFADLSVTGKAAFAAFVKERPDEKKLGARQDCRGASAAAMTMALDRAYAVANALRKDHASKDRQNLGWIAVSGEDDQPYRPVNVPSTKFPQFNLRVDVRGVGSPIPVNTRYMIAHKSAPRVMPPGPLVDGGARIVAGDLPPAIANDAEVLLFIHGMDSRAEEAEDLTEALHALPGTKNWTVIAVDLPTSGYADNINPARIAPANLVTCHYTPVLDFIEEFIVAFVDTLDSQVSGRLKPRIRAVIGGSLGGNMSMRLGRRPNTPWIRNVVPWSPAAIWPSKIAQKNAVAAGCDTSWNPMDDRAVDMMLTWSGKDPFFLPESEPLGIRRLFFYGGFDWAPVFGLGGPSQAQCWYSDKWACKQDLVRASRIDRQETYDPNFRAWHWRLAGEQLAFSQQQFADGTSQPLYLRNTKRTLLICGYDDTCADLCKNTREVGVKMVNTPGYARFMKQTGHSVDNEYPVFIARQLAEFLQ